MSVGTITVAAVVAITGTTATTTIPFRFEAGADLVVQTRATGGAWVTKTLGTHFTVSGGNTNDGGLITWTPALSITGSVRVRRRTSKLQGARWKDVEAFPALGVEAALDRLTLAVQEAQDAGDRAFKVQPGEAGAELPTAAERAAKFFTFDETGAPKMLSFDEATSTATMQLIAAFLQGGAHVDVDYAPETNIVTISVAMTAADVGADPAGTAAAAIIAHVAVGNPHPQYALATAVTAALANKSDTSHGHGDATIIASGFMSAADKEKLDGIPSGGLTPALSNATPAALGTAAPGTAIQAARADHVHPAQTAAGIGAEPAGTAANAISTHVGLADPHTQYALESDVATALSGKQGADSKLTAFTGLSFAANKFWYLDGSGVQTLGAITANARALLGDANVPRLSTQNTFTQRQDITAPSGSGIMFANYGSAGSPLAVDPTYGYTGLGVGVHGNPGTGLANAFVCAASFDARLSAGTGLIAVAGYFNVTCNGTWGPGGSPEAGGVAIFTSAGTSRGGVVFGAGFHAGADTTTGASIRGIEIDTFAAVSVNSKIGIELVSPNGDPGAISGTLTINGSGATIPDCVGLRIGAIGAGHGWDTAISTIKVTGGAAPMPTSGRLWRAGGFTCTYGLQWGDMTFSAAAIALPQTSIVLSTGNALGRLTGLYSGAHDDLYIASNYSFAAAAVDSSALGTAAIRVRAVNPGNGAIDFMTGAVNTAPSVKMYLSAGLVVGSPSGADKGAGTINAVAVYDDNVLLTDLVLDYWVDGAFDGERYASHPLAREVAPAWFEPESYISFIRKERRLPGMLQWDDPAARPSLGETVTRLTGAVETQAVLFAGVHDRLTHIEQRLAA